jgi:hypothetical protein
LVDEIYVEYRDIDILTDIIDNYPNKNIAVIFNSNTPIDWTFLKACHSQAQYLTCECSTLDQILNCRNYGLNFYWSQAIQSFYELHQIINLGVDSVYIGPELFFNYDKLLNVLNVPIRLIPNVVNNNAFNIGSGVCAPWVRPEDINLYDNGRNICRFDLQASNLIQERTLFNLYSKDKKWPGNMNDVIHNLKADCRGIFIDDSFGYRRLNCNNICQKGGACRFCERAASLSTHIN